VGFLNYSKEKAMLTAGLAVFGMVIYWSFSKLVLQNLDSNPSAFTPFLFVIFTALCLPLVVGIALINRLGTETVVLNSTILAFATIITFVYLYIAACIMVAGFNRMKKK
jgi:hypothetical protein